MTRVGFNDQTFGAVSDVKTVVTKRYLNVNIDFKVAGLFTTNEILAVGEVLDEGSLNTVNRVADDRVVQWFSVLINDGEDE